MRPRPVSCVGWSTKVNNAVECSIKASLHVPLFFVCEADLTGTAVSSPPPPHPPARHLLLNQLLQALVIDLALRLVHREPSLKVALGSNLRVKSKRDRAKRLEVQRRCRECAFWSLLVFWKQACVVCGRRGARGRDVCR